MKNLFRLAGLALAVSVLFAACEKDPIGGGDDNGDGGSGDEPQVVVPEFPTPVTADVVAGSEYTLTIAPNVAWEVTVPEATANFFQIKDGENLVYKKRGEAGEHTIVIAVSAVEDFDEDHVCDVQMTMQGETKSIATLTLTRKERELKIYSVVVEDGAFGYATEGDLTYAYNSTTVGAEGVAMIWPMEMGLYSIRVKVESNFNWIIDGAPEWIAPIAGGTAGVTELWIKGNETKYPLERSTATLSFVDAVVTDKVVATLNVSIPSATEIFMVEGFTEQTAFNYKGEIYNTMVGEYVEGGVNATVTAINGSKVCAVEFVETAGLVQPTLNPEWLTLTYAEWDASNAAVIQSRTLSVAAKQNEGAVRKATVLVMPQAVATEDIDRIAVNGEITAEYLPYVVTTVEQAAALGSIEIVGEETMSALGTTIAGLDASHWMFGEFAGASVGYDLLYTSQWAHEDWYVNVVRPYTAIKCFSFNEQGALVEITGDDAWISTTVFGAESNRVRVLMDVTKPTAAASKNALTGDYEGAVAFYDADGVFAFIYCRYNEAAASISADVAFYYPEYAAQQNSTLVELTSGDLYTKYASYGEKVYHLTFTTATPNMSMLVGLPQTWSYVNQADESWLKYEYSFDSQVVMMSAETGNGKTGALVFGDGALVLVCTLNIAK